MQYSKVADGDINPSRFCSLGNIVNVGDGIARQSVQGSIPFGVSTSTIRRQIGGLEETLAAKAGDNIRIMGPGEPGGGNIIDPGLSAEDKLLRGLRPMLQLGVGGCQNGDRLKPDPDGRGVVARDPGDIFGAVAMQIGRQGVTVEVQVTQPTPIHTQVT